MQDQPPDTVQSFTAPMVRPEVPPLPKPIPVGYIWIYELIDVIGRHLFGDANSSCITAHFNELIKSGGHESAGGSMRLT